MYGGGAGEQARKQKQAFRARLAARLVCLMVSTSAGSEGAAVVVAAFLALAQYSSRPHPPYPGRRIALSSHNADR
jgi:hypothetical protein